MVATPSPPSLPGSHSPPPPYAIFSAFSAGVNATGISGTIPAGNIGNGTITSNMLATGAVGSGQLAAGAAAANLNALGQSAVPGGGMVLSSNYNDTNLVNAGYVKLGKVDLGDDWEQRGGGTPPSARDDHTAVWTGSEMIVWGGSNDSSYFNDGARYNPSANTWTAVTITGASVARNSHTAVWTGSEMIVWGGYNGIYLNDTFSYRPSRRLYLYQRL
jgi:hypothetical protein